MKRQLIILRHAQPEDYGMNVKDHDRVLTEAGIEQAKKMGNLFKENSLNPGTILSSDAARAKQTAELLTEVTGSSYTLEPKLYSSSPSQVLSVVSKVSSDVSSLMIVGHNPTFSELSMKLTMQPVMMGQGQCLVLEAELEDWSLVNTVTWELALDLRP